MKFFTRKLKSLWWTWNGYFGRSVALDIPQRVTVLVTFFHPARMGHIDTLVRNVLKCAFVERLILSNHNPQIRIEDKLKVRDARLILLNQSVPRGCGYRWLVAQQFSPDYLIVIDDDIWLFPSQLASLFKHLVAEPAVPHGITGMIRFEDGKLAFVDSKEMPVDYLCETYAVTGKHLQRFFELRDAMATDAKLARLIDASADFTLISQSGSQRPHIHQIGRIFRDPSFTQAGVAVHKGRDFPEDLFVVDQALTQLGQRHANIVQADVVAK